MEPQLRRRAERRYQKFIERINLRCKVLRFESNPKKRNADCLIFLREKQVAGAELEWAARWRTSEWPYETIRWPISKKRYANSKLPIFIVTINNEGTTGAIIDAATWVKDGSEERAGRARSPTGRMATYGEPFWGIDPARVVFGFENFEPFILKKLGLRK